ncbi:RNA recognition motif domain [Macleaya cordata]|uniref:RNA recognition motif domain n=1 Tax=Macleaya cordata TaxID=56857 RepID=A0A200QUQ2_MACCD|nr:RNA recognition motif domain [Macleaya cordata]
MRPIFCGNFEYDARQSDLERLFNKYGKVERVDMKSGFAFVYMDDERDAEDAIRGLDRAEFGRQGRRLRVEWTKQERGIRRPAGSRRSSANSKPTKTLFVINFDPIHTRTRDLERHFDPYGKILNIRIRRNFAFIQFESQDDATKALDATNMSKLMDRVISVEYAVRDDDERRNGYSPDRRGGGRSRDRGRSPSPYRRDRASPDYGRAPSPNRRHEPRESPYRKERASPDYGHGPSPNKRHEPRESPYRRDRGSPDYGRGRSPSPNKRNGSRASPEYGRGRSPSPNKRNGSRDSPYQRERVSPGYGRQHEPSPSPGRRPEPKESPNNNYGRPESPVYERHRSFVTGDAVVLPRQGKDHDICEKQRRASRSL